MKTWLEALFSETLSRVWLILSAFSTLVTFFMKGWSGKPLLVSATSMILGFAWANLKVFQKQQAEIARLEAAQRMDEEDRIHDLQELRAAIVDALDLARTWMQHVPGIIPNPQAIPDPSQITENRLLDVRSHARRISAHCEKLVFDAHTALRNARAQFEKLRQATHGPFRLTSSAGYPQPFLDAAYDCLLQARRIVDDYDPQARSDGQANTKQSQPPDC
jgi:cell division protein FtsB